MKFLDEEDAKLEQEFKQFFNTDQYPGGMIPLAVKNEMKIFHDKGLADIEKRAKKKFGSWIIERANYSDDDIKKEIN